MGAIFFRSKALLYVGFLLALTAQSLTALAQVKSVASSFKIEAFMSVIGEMNVKTDNPVSVLSVVADNNQIRVKMSESASQLPFTTDIISRLQDSARAWCGKPTATLTIYTPKRDLTKLAFDPSFDAQRPAPGSAVRRVDIGFGGSMDGRSIALWPSHGRYYEQSLKRWEWQRGRLFTTVEDLLTPSFVLPFLIPMLENAGCMVYTPRERDTTRVCAIVDNDDPHGAFFSTTDAVAEVKGYGHIKTIRNRMNPFAIGTARGYTMLSGDSIVFTGHSDRTGYQMVYMAYATMENSADSALVIVRSAGSEARYIVNQRQGGSMWVPLGRHYFEATKEWTLTIKGEGLITADAVRVGGGMGIVERNGSLSGMPAWAEGARYYLQADGFDYDEVVSLSDGKNDYTDDINGRGEWVNALVKNKNVHVDAALAFHTDAGITLNDTTIGTLALITTNKDKGILPDGRSRTTSRQLAGSVEWSIANDIRKMWNPKWTLRGINDKNYSEARRPDAPTVLLELLSHQNPVEIEYALHPAFRRDVARSVYKGLLRYICGPEAAVTPLPPTHFGIKFHDEGVLLTWRAAVDSLEPTAVADSFLVYERERLVCATADTFAVIRQAKDGLPHAYHVVAIGKGGRSFPTQTLSACLWRRGKKALLVDGYDRLASPTVVTSPFFAGVINAQDAGAAWDGDIYSCGDQYDYNAQSQWLDDDAPGCGASYTNREMVSNAGSHGPNPSPITDLLRQKNYSYVSQTKEAFDADTLETETYDLVRIALGRQKTTKYGTVGTRHSIYTPGFCRHVESILGRAEQIIISGNYIGTDAATTKHIHWCQRVLGFTPRTGHASYLCKPGVSQEWLNENFILRPDPSAVWHLQVDAIEPYGNGSQTIVRYDDSVMSAGIKNGKITVVGF